MTLEKAIQTTMILSNHLLTPREIEDYIIQNKLSEQKTGLLKDINNYLSIDPAFYEFNGSYLFVPSDDAIGILKESLENLEPNSQALAVLKNLGDFGKIMFFDVINYSDPRIRYVFFKDMAGYIFSHYEYATEFINEFLEDDNEKVFALFVLYFQSPSIFWAVNFNKINYDVVLARIEDVHFYKSIISELGHVLANRSSMKYIKAITSLLFRKNSIAEFLIDYLLKNPPISTYVLYFYILANWEKFEEILLQYSISRDQIIEIVESASENEGFIKHIPMMKYCNSPNLEMRLLAIGFMSNKITSGNWVAKLNIEDKLLTPEIKQKILKAYANNKDVGGIKYAKEWFVDPDPILKVQSTVTLGELGGEKEKQFILKKLSKKKDVDWEFEHLNSALQMIISRENNANTN